MKNITVLSTFDGIATGLLTLKELGYTVNYYASEIEEGAMKVAMKNHPEIVQIGDVTKVKYSDGILYTEKGNFNVGKIDLILGGSPCNDLSLQHKERLGLKGSLSSLFYEYYRLYKEINPKYFFLENVGMKKEPMNEISELLGVNPVEINSNLISAQNRKRLYWTNIPNVTIPEDKKIKLQDIIEDGYVDREKSNCILESTSRFCVTPSSMRRYMYKNFGQIVFPSREEYEKYVGKTRESRIAYAKWLWSQNSKNLVEGVHTPKFRLVSPIEVERLQTLPENYTYVEDFYYNKNGTYNKDKGDRKRISVMGEGWTKDVILHILKNMVF